MESSFPLAVHNSFVAYRSAIEKLKSKGLEKIAVDCKLGSRAYERIWGLAFFCHEELHKKVIPGDLMRKHHGGR